MFKNLFDRKFLVAFTVALIFNLLIITFVFSSGVYTGFNGAFGWDIKSFGNTIGSIFGSFTSFVMLLGTLVIIAVVLWFTHWLARRDKKIWIVLWVAVVAIMAALIGPSIHIAEFNIAFVFFLVLVAFSAIQTWIFRLMFVPRTQPAKTVVKTVTTKSATKPATAK